jgi:hypothetical protein
VYSAPADQKKNASPSRSDASLGTSLVPKPYAAASFRTYPQATSESSNFRNTKIMRGNRSKRPHAKTHQRANAESTKLTSDVMVLNAFAPVNCGDVPNHDTHRRAVRTRRMCSPENSDLNHSRRAQAVNEAAISGVIENIAPLDHATCALFPAVGDVAPALRRVDNNPSRKARRLAICGLRREAGVHYTTFCHRPRAVGESQRCDGILRGVELPARTGTCVAAASERQHLIAGTGAGPVRSR